MKAPLKSKPAAATAAAKESRVLMTDGEPRLAVLNETELNLLIQGEGRLDAMQTILKSLIETSDLDESTEILKALLDMAEKISMDIGIGLNEVENKIDEAKAVLKERGAR